MIKDIVKYPSPPHAKLILTDVSACFVETASLCCFYQYYLFIRSFIFQIFYDSLKHLFCTTKYIHELGKNNFD